MHAAWSSNSQWQFSVSYFYQQKLGMRAPAGLDAAVIAAEAGPDLLVPTIDVETQQSGPRMKLQQWADYFAHPPGSVPSGRPRRRRPLLNVVSLSLAGTPLEVPFGNLP